jgi:glycine hydroxymethyltransferase
MLVDVFSKGVTGRVAEAALGKAGITVNKNAIPFDQNPPMVASGIRVGTPAVTTRGMKEADMDTVGALILRALDAHADDVTLSAIKREVESLCERFPLYSA